MKNIPIINLETGRLILKKPIIDEQFALWNILKEEKVNRYYFPTPDRIFIKNNLKKDNIYDLKKARKIFMEQLSDWNRQKPFYDNKILDILNEEPNQKYTWSIFLRTNDPIGQITVQPQEKYPNNPEVRNVGWFIDPKYQGNGYATEAAFAVLNFMFNSVEIEKVETSAAIINQGSWKIMEKLGFERVGEYQSTYFDEDDNILMSYCYVGNKENFNNSYNNYKKEEQWLGEFI